MKIEREILLKKQLNTILNKCLSFTSAFLKKYEQPDLKEEINNFICTHSIYDNKEKIIYFANIIMNASKKNIDQILEIQENSEIIQKRKNELNKIQTFINNNKKLLGNESKQKDIKNLLPPPSPPPPLKEDQNKKEQKDIIDNNLEDKDEDKDNNIDIIVEDTKVFEKKKFLQKKTKFQNDNNDLNNDLNNDNNEQSKKIYFTNCYMCKVKLISENIHKFYGNLCIKCGNYSYSFREMKLDFSGRIAIVTGGRVKIGYHIATKLLSYGCKVLITSRFPKDTLLKYKENSEYEKWKNNLIIYPIDFRIFESTVKFVNFIKDNFPHIDFLINNAAQTIRRTAEYYKYLLPIESKELNPDEEEKIIKTDYISIQKQLNEGEKNKNIKDISNSLISLANNTNPEYKEILPLSVIASQIKIMEEKEQPKLILMGEDGQPYDFSKGKSSWSFEFDEIPLQEFTEVQIINAWTPYYLCVKLKSLMMKSPFSDKYIVNVTSPEGVFLYKRSTHVHTNMAKAALNMFTFTCGRYLKKDGIYMTCVDTGWITSMKEINKFMDDKKKNHIETIFKNVPLDELDGAMRVLHPIIEGIKNKNYLSGVLLRNF